MSENPTSNPPLFTREQANQIAASARVEEGKRLRALYLTRLHAFSQDELSPSAAGRLMDIVRGVE